LRNIISETVRERMENLYGEELQNIYSSLNILMALNQERRNRRDM
jgi:hypothetical protein